MNNSQPKLELPPHDVNADCSCVRWKFAKWNLGIPAGYRTE